MKHEYERRIFLVGFSELLQNDVLPDSLQPVLIGLINAMVDILHSLVKAEEREAKRKAKAEMGNDDTDSQGEEEYDSEEEMSDGSDDIEVDDEDHDSDKAVKSKSRQIDENDLGFVNREENKGSDSDEGEVYGSENEEDADIVVSTFFSFTWSLVWHHSNHGRVRQSH